MAKKKKKLNLKRFIPFCIICALLIAGIGFGIAKLAGKGPDNPGPKVCVHEYVDGICSLCGEKDPNYVKPDEIIELSIACGGDIMYHVSQLKGAYNNDGDGRVANTNDFPASTGSFSFDREYQYIKPYVESADLALANLETTFAGGPNYSGSWARFNCPDGLAKTLKETGFDVIFTSNNHSLDRKLAGLKRTVQVLRESGLQSVGSRENTEDSRSLVTTVKGVKVGIVSYTYETAMVGGSRTLNGSAMEQNAWDYLNTFRYGSDGLTVSEDKKAIADEISRCRAQGAEIVICYFHWDATNEYVLKVTKLQRDLASFAAENGADIIFGSHPHRVQEMEVLEVNADGRAKTVPVYYSLGNFVSNQRYESLTPYGDPEAQARATEEELLAYLELSYNRTKGEIEFKTISAVPIWLDRFSSGGHFEYRIIPLTEGFESNKDLKASGHADRAKKALSNLTGIIGEQYIYTKAYAN